MRIKTKNNGRPERGVYANSSHILFIFGSIIRTVRI